jgi:hypothetical protein
MTKWFNTAGPCQPDIHYTLPTSQRLPQLKRLIDQRNYFVIHAPRQTGKTSAMLTLAQELTASGKYTAVLLSLEVGSVFSHDLGTAERAILDEWKQSVKFHLPANLQPTTWPEVSTGSQIGTFLSTWATDSPLPLVVFLDEIDVLTDTSLISVLRQIRSGYPRRPQGFPQCVALIGMRDVRDYKVASGGTDRLNTSSFFNIKVESFNLSNLTLEDVSNLYGQHTQATGQIFTPEAINHAYHLTQGQPWLVNAIARQVTEYLAEDANIPITVDLIDQAKDILIENQDTYFSTLENVLKVRRIGKRTDD